MTDPFQKLAKLKELYPDDIERIEADEKRLNELLATQQEFAGLPVVRGLIDLCRKDIVFARKALATNRQLDEKARAELWHIVDAREWFISCEGLFRGGGTNRPGAGNRIEPVAEPFQLPRIYGWGSHGENHASTIDNRLRPHSGRVRRLRPKRCSVEEIPDRGH
jgi:hypothetical protein